MEEMTRLFNLDFQLLHDTVLLAIAIFFLFLALSYLLFNPVRKMLKDRQEKIATDIDRSESAAAYRCEWIADQVLSRQVFGSSVRRADRVLRVGDSHSVLRWRERQYPAVRSPP